MNIVNQYMANSIVTILRHGYIDENPRPKYSDGAPAHTISINQTMRKYDLSNNEFPICSLRPIAWKSAIKEILWIYQDQSNSLELLRNKYKVTYWDSWESKDVPKTIGERYGKTVSNYDMVNKLIKNIKEDPYGRRKIMNLWQENDLNATDGLAPCAFLTMWSIRNDVYGNKFLDMTLVQRSGDMITASGAGGVNECQYAALLMMIAQSTGYLPGIFCHFVQNEQIYSRHVDIAKEIHERYIDNKDLPTPRLILNPNKTDFYDFTIDDFTLENYEPLKPNFKLDLGI